MIWRKKHIGRYMLMAGFFLLLLLPNIVLLGGFENTDNKENKKVTAPPTLDLKQPNKMLAQYKTYYEKNFGLRATLINGYFNFKTGVLKENPLPNHVIKGKENWYFLGNTHDDILNDTFGNIPFTPSELHAISQNLVEINAYLASKNIKFYLVVPPNKQSLYKENLPYQVPTRTRRWDQLQKHLTHNSALSFISLEPRLTSEKTKRTLYHKTDSHWNDYGAYIGYEETVKLLKKDFEIPSVPLEDYVVKSQSIIGDITTMLQQYSPEDAVKLEKIEPSPIDTLSYAYTFQHYRNPSKNLTLLMHSDSFSNAWIPFFNESFGETLYVKTYDLDKKLIESLRPDIVIYEIVERNLFTLIHLKSE